MPSPRVSLLLLCLSCGCAREVSLVDAPVPVASSQVAPESSAAVPIGAVLTEPAEKQFEGIRLTIPAGWEEQPVASEFIQAEYRATGDGGPARMTLSSAGGGIEPNLQRWQGQFQRRTSDPEPQRTTLVVGGVEAVVIELHGTFTDGFSGKGPQPNSMMLGAIIPTGPANFFLKLTGPRETVAAQKDAFFTLVSSAKLDR